MTSTPKRTVARRAATLLACLFLGAFACGATNAQQAEAKPDQATQFAKRQLPTYRVITLGKGCPKYQAFINAKDQVAFTMNNGSDYRGFFYDGKTVRDIGSLGGTFSLIYDLNNVGQLTGVSQVRTNLVHAFVWSAATGIIDVGALPNATEAYGSAINNKGQVAGRSAYVTPSLTTYHAFTWTAANGVEDLGTLAGQSSTATDINDMGTIVGASESPAGIYHAFAWTRGSGMMDLGTLGGDYSFAVTVGPRGEVAGNSTVSANTPQHAFLWTRSHGMLDLGAAGGTDSEVVAMSPNDKIAGNIRFANGSRHAMTWTRPSGMLDLGTLGGSNSTAFAINKKGLVVGHADVDTGQRHAFAWLPGYGMMDLNKRLHCPPQGLVLEAALAVSDDGSIVAAGAAGGIFLLQPVHEHSGAAATDAVGMQ